jgi:hypothetical protein
MNLSRSPQLVMSFVILAALACHCSSEDSATPLGATGGAGGDAGVPDGSSGSGGSTGTGGLAGSAGTGGAAGNMGTGGLAGSAGTGGAAGNTGTGGLAGSAGTGGAAGSTGTGGLAGSAGTGGTGGSTGFQWKDCQPGSTPCLAGASCVEVLAAGFAVCSEPTPDPVAPCDPDGGGPGPGSCCAQHTDCNASELCVTQYTGVGYYNVCEADACVADAQCSQGTFCVPRGVLGAIVRVCLPATCRLDSDCSATTGGRCAPVTAGKIGDCATVGMFCVYPSLGGCRAHFNCPAGSHCEADIPTGEARCVAGDPQTCPAVP